MQKDDVNKKKLPNDTIVRVYNTQDFNYLIQPEDILSIRFESLTEKEYDFFSMSEVSGSQTMSQNSNPLLIGELVDPNGNVPFPVIGKVKVSGLTVYQVQDTLQKIANQYLQSPIVKVRIINFRVTILGEVRREGAVYLQNNRVSVLEAFALVGGLTDLADKTNVKLIRQINGKTEVQYLNLLDEELVQSPYYYIHQNDLLIVPALRQRPYQVYFGKNLALMISTLSLLVLTINLIQK
jgi:polysaccharide export outer membrane protein